MLVSFSFSQGICSDFLFLYFIRRKAGEKIGSGCAGGGWDHPASYGTWHIARIDQHRLYWLDSSVIPLFPTPKSSTNNICYYVNRIRYYNVLIIPFLHVFLERVKFSLFIRGYLGIWSIWIFLDVRALDIWKQCWTGGTWHHASSTLPYYYCCCSKIATWTRTETAWINSGVVGIDNFQEFMTRV